jgi:hypothetical protein
VAFLSDAIGLVRSSRTKFRASIFTDIWLTVLRQQCSVQSRTEAGVLDKIVENGVSVGSAHGSVSEFLILTNGGTMITNNRFAVHVLRSNEIKRSSFVPSLLHCDGHINHGLLDLDDGINVIVAGLTFDASERPIDTLLTNGLRSRCWRGCCRGHLCGGTGRFDGGFRSHR